jgi:hypothetical protein
MGGLHPPELVLLPGQRMVVLEQGQSMIWLPIPAPGCTGSKATPGSKFLAEDTACTYRECRWDAPQKRQVPALLALRSQHQVCPAADNADNPSVPAASVAKSVRLSRTWVPQAWEGAPQVEVPSVM